MYAAVANNRFGISNPWPPGDPSIEPLGRRDDPTI
jgi:hypothetical protein